MELMTSGAFARASGLSRKALRLYDELGLLHPAQVDPATSYRFYEPGQLERARLVAWLRRLGMPLADIRSVSALPAAQAAVELATYWAQVEAETSARRELAVFLIGYLSGKDTAMHDGEETLTVRYAVRSDTGLHREGNEDAAYAGTRLLAVADGIVPPGGDAREPWRSADRSALADTSHRDDSPMIRRSSPTRVRPRVEALDSRALLSVGAQGLWPLANPSSTDTLLVQFAQSSTPDQQSSLLASFRGSVVSKVADGPELVQIGEGFDLSAIVKSVQGASGVLYAQANSTVQASALAVTPDDPSFGTQWGLDNANNVDIDAPEAWGVTTGLTSTIVAVIDSGIDLSNPDLAGKLWTNPGNDYALGYANDFHGWNFIANNNDVQDDEQQGHGTHVSGIIAAAANDAYGVAGVNWNAKIMPLKFLDATGTGSVADAVSAIYFAVNHGARVINASWGGVDGSPALQAAISYANSRNVVFVTAAGNDGTDNDYATNYPASFHLANELSVASVDRFGQLSTYSNYGAATVSIGAPGTDILSDAPSYVSPTRLEVLSGTSMSTAFVSGVASLVAGADPSLTASQIVGRLITTAKPLPSLAGKTIAGGMVDAASALAAGPATATGGVPAAGLPTLTPGASTVEDVHASILASDEYFAAHGGTADGFISGLYEELLGRTPDPAGLQEWVGLYGSGTVTRFQIARDILVAPEARLTEVAHWYQDDLGRTAFARRPQGSTPGVAAWANLLELWGSATIRVHDAIMSAPSSTSINHGATPRPRRPGVLTTTSTTGTPAPPRNTAWAGLLYSGLRPVHRAPLLLRGHARGPRRPMVAQLVRRGPRPRYGSDRRRSRPIPGVQAWAADPRQLLSAPARELSRTDPLALPTAWIWPIGCRPVQRRRSDRHHGGSLDANRDRQAHPGGWPRRSMLPTRHPRIERPPRRPWPSPNSSSRGLPPRPRLASTPRPRLVPGIPIGPEHRSGHGSSRARASGSTSRARTARRPSRSSCSGSVPDRAPRRPAVRRPRPPDDPRGGLGPGAPLSSPVPDHPPLAAGVVPGWLGRPLRRGLRGTLGLCRDLAPPEPDRLDDPDLEDGGPLDLREPPGLHRGPAPRFRRRPGAPDADRRPALRGRAHGAEEHPPPVRRPADGLPGRPRRQSRGGRGHRPMGRVDPPARRARRSLAPATIRPTRGPPGSGATSAWS